MTRGELRAFWFFGDKLTFYSFILILIPCLPD